MAIDPTALNELGGLANRVLNETSIGGNTAERIGTALVDAHTCLVGANDMSSDIESLQSSVSSLDTSLHGVQGDISTLSGDITELRSADSALDSRVSTLESEVGTLEAGDFVVLMFYEVVTESIEVSTMAPPSVGDVVWSTSENDFALRNTDSSYAYPYYHSWSSHGYYFKNGTGDDSYRSYMTTGINRTVLFWCIKESKYYYWDGSTLSPIE